MCNSVAQYNKRYIILYYIVHTTKRTVIIDTTPSDVSSHGSRQIRFRICILSNTIIKKHVLNVINLQGAFK